MNHSLVRTYAILAVAFTSIMSFAQKNSSLYDEFLKNKKTSLLQDFSYAGYHYNEKEIPSLPNQIDVSTHGILPNTGEDLTDKVQQLIDKIGQSGGGVLYFPRGRYCFNMDSTKVNHLKVDYNNIVFRGENASENGTIFYCGRKTLQNKYGWLSPFLIRFGHKIQHTKSFWGVEPLNSNNPEFADDEVKALQVAKVLANITAPAKRGDSRLILADASKVKAGDVVIVAMYNTDSAGSLILDLLNYKAEELTKNFKTARMAAPLQVASFQWLVEVKKVNISNNTIELYQPLRYDLSMQYKPVIAEAAMLSECGVENIRFTSAWDGKYVHHGNTEMDYGWNAVNFCRVKHGWMRNVVIDNYTNPVYLQDSRNITIDNLITIGANGHSAIKIYGHACDNLVKNVTFVNNFTHLISSEGNAYGNVFTKIKYNMDDSISGRFDAHGFAHPTYAPPSWNLFELMQDITRMDGGGSARNMPHTAKHNVWWNCTTGNLAAPTEFFAHNEWRKSNRIDHHLMYPASIIVGFNSPNYKLVVNGSDIDRTERLINVEALNRQVLPVSLFEAQLKQRLGKK